MNTTCLNHSDEGRNRWAILSMLFAIHVLTAIGQFSIPPLLPLIKRGYGLNHTEVGFLTGSFFLGVAVTSVIAGWAVDLFGVRRMIFFGTLLLGGALIAAAWMPWYAVMMFLFVIAGIGYSVVTPSSNKAVMLWFKEHLRATAMGFKQTGINGGGFLAGIIIPSVALAFNWQWALSTSGLMVMGALFFILYIFKKESASQRFLPVEQWFIKLKRVISNRNILLLSMEGFLRVGVQMAFLTYLVLSLQKVFGLSLLISSFLFSSAHGAGAAGRIVWGLLSDRIFRGRRKFVYLLIGLIAMAGFFLLGILGSQTPFWIVFLVTACLGFTAAGHQGVSLTLMAECAGTELTGTATGLGQSLCYLGAGLASPGFGFMIDRFGFFTYAWNSLALLSFLCCVILFFVNEGPISSTSRQRSAPENDTCKPAEMC